MTMSTARQIFVNMPVRNLEASKAFFAKLGFEFNPKFTDAKAACMVLSEQGYVMLLERSFFATFTKRELVDASRATEMLVAVSCGSRAEVDALADKALASGGREAMPAQDHGFMYFRTFYDLDDHHWEVLWMDPAAAS
jgi:predicted lactoylglutathione lyase